MDIVSILWIVSSYQILVTDVCESNTIPVLTSSKHWHVFENEPVGSIVTRLKARDMEGDDVTFTLESQRFWNQDLHTYFTLDKQWRVLVAKPLTGLAGDGSKDYILRVRLNDGIIAPIAEVRLQIMKETEEGGTGEEGEDGGGEAQGNPGRRRRLGGRHISGDLRIGGSKSDILLPNYGILGTVGFENNFGFIPSLWDAHPPLLQVNRTWAVRADAKLGTFVDTIRVLEVAGHGYNITLHGSRGLLHADPSSGKVTVAASLLNQDSDLNIVVAVSNGYGGSSKSVVFKVLPISSSSSNRPPVKPSNPRVKFLDRIEVGSHLTEFGEANDSLNSGSEKSKAKAKWNAYTLTCLILMPILAVVCISSVVTAVVCYCQRIQLRKDMAEFQISSLAYIPK